MQNKKIIVIGAGAAGLMAGITAAMHGCQVTLLEHTNHAGQKIERTGNGRCNYTNSNQKMEFYHGDDLSVIESVLSQFNAEETLSFFSELGIFPKERSGYYYPFSDQASAVRDVLVMQAARLKVKIACNVEVVCIERNEERFCIQTQSGYVYEADRVILATGSMAAPATGSDGSGYTLAASLGHKIVPPVPALVQLLSHNSEVSLLAGLRIYAQASLWIDGKQRAEETGEIQFIKNGLSGIPVFQLSREASIVLHRYTTELHSVEVRFHLLPQMDKKQLWEFLQERSHQLGGENLAQFLTGLFHEKMIKVLCKKVKVKGDQTVDSFTADIWKELMKQICSLSFIVYDTQSFEQAQVCAGGVSLKQVMKNTLESKICPGVFFAGELLDVDGACGGYNLQWAWSSGYAAGKHAALD